MGGSPSKERKSKSQVGGQEGKKARYKAAAKSAKHARPGKKSSRRTRTVGGGEQEGAVSASHGGPGGDVAMDDLKPPAPRGRSKSLRFGDFTQLDRVRKVDDTDLLPIDIAFFQDGKVDPDELCHVCSVYTGMELLICGVCYRAFHQGCLSKIHQWPGPPDPDIWTCHQCANLGNLLTEQEVITVLKRLDICGIRREDDISLSDYLAFVHVSLQEDEGKVLTRDKADNARRRFAHVDTAARGRITWCQFLNIEAVRILNRRNKNALVRMLTAAELERARDAFRILDTDKDGRITKAIAHEALDRNSRRSGYYPDETMMYIDDDLNQSVSWMDFLRDRAIYIIAERPCLRSAPLDHSTMRRKGSNRSSLAAAPSMQATPLPQAAPLAHTPPLPHSKAGLTKKASLPMSVSASSTTQVYRQQSSAPSLTPLRYSDGAAHSARQGARIPSLMQHRSVPTTPVKKQSTGAFPLLPPPPASSRPSQRAPASSPPTPVHKAAPDCLTDCGQGAVHVYQYPDRSVPSLGGHCGQLDSTAGARLSGGSDHSVGGSRRLSGHSQPDPFSRAVPADLSAGKVRRFSHEDPSSGSGVVGHCVTAKPPAGGHSRAVAAPPFGKLVERVQRGEYRHNQARSMHLAQGSTPAFGLVAGDNGAARRPLSLV